MCGQNRSLYAVSLCSRVQFYKWNILHPKNTRLKIGQNWLQSVIWLKRSQFLVVDTVQGHHWTDFDCFTMFQLPECSFQRISLWRITWPTDTLWHRPKDVPRRFECIAIIAKNHSMMRMWVFHSKHCWNE